MAPSIRIKRLSSINDPIGVECIQTSVGNLETEIIPDRACDIYRVKYKGNTISYLNTDAALSPTLFREDGASGFQKNFFGGMMTTCGLLQAGRPCNENGRKFGLHGCISNTAAEIKRIDVQEDCVIISSEARETHPEGESMLLQREIQVKTDGIRIRDRVVNCGIFRTPIMMMYHVNFGAPFLSPCLKIQLPFQYIEDRDTGNSVDENEVLSILPAGSREVERVFYTKSQLDSGAILDNRELGIRCLMKAVGDNLPWTGIWQNYCRDKYAYGIEPCICPGLGRVRARERGLLSALEPGEEINNEISLLFSELI